MMSLRAAAKAYIDQQIEIMTKHGSAPRLSKSKYKGLITAAYKDGLQIRRSARARLKASQKVV